VGAWKDWKTKAGKHIPLPTKARLQEVTTAVKPTRTTTTNLTTSLREIRDDAAYVEMKPEARDYEDVSDESTWYRFPGKEGCYLCGHWTDRCRERKCNAYHKTHVCCHEGLNREKKLNSLRRPEYKRKGNGARKR
jgi:hypothetical protein